MGAFNEEVLTRLAWMRDVLAARGMISPEDLDLLTVVDDPDDVVAAIEAATP